MAGFRTSLGALAAAWLGCAGAAGAQDRSAAIDAIFAFAGPDTPGCAVGVARPGEARIVRVYGAADLARGAPITAQTTFDIGSVQKQFVAAAVLLLVEDGKLSLSEDVRSYLPELPDYGHAITLVHLMTHTSGVRDWTGLLPLAAEETDALSAVLRQRSLNFAPGEEWAYSNSGVVLMKEIVARVSGRPFGDFLEARIFAPLGMEASRYSVDMRDGGEAQALAYEKTGDAWAISMRTDADRGTGGILSTVGDMLTWNEALSSGRLGPFVTDRLHTSTRLNNGREIQFTHGLVINDYRGVKRIWHSGGSAGYSAWLGRFPEQGLSVALACNGDVDGGDLAHEVIDLFLEDAQAPTTPPSASAQADPALAAKAGLFIGKRDGDLLRLVVERGMLRVANGPPLKVEVAGGVASFRPLRPEPFFMSQDDFTLRFESADAFVLTTMEGATTRYQRAAPYAPTQDALKAFEGRYESDELDATFEVSAVADGLAMRLAHAPQRALPLKPVAPDIFQVAQIVVRFVRDEKGAVSGLSYSNPVLRGVMLTRTP